jgi:hypothetical protein
LYPSNIRQQAWVPLLLACLAAMLVAIHLAPLPYDVWSELPGRSLESRILDGADIVSLPMPLSVDPEATRSSAFALLPGFAILIAGLALSYGQRRLLCAMVLVVAIASACLGALQVASSNPSSFSFESAHLGIGIGLFVNRNHQADLLLIGILLAGALADRSNRDRFAIPAYVSYGAILLLAAGVLATTSRTALAMLPAVLAASIALQRPRLAKTMIAVACAAVGLGAAWWLGVLPAALARFQGETELRTEFWSTTLTAIPLYWPYGSGIGTFKTVFPLVESLGSVSPFVVNQAHNDYLQLVLEGGAASGGLLLMFGIFFGLRGFRLFGGAAAAADPGLSRAAWLGMAVLLTHSLVDYPLRNASLLALFGLLASLLVPAPRPWGSAAKTVAA